MSDERQPPATDARERRRHADAHLADLTPRQREVLDLVAAGRSNPEIAERLGISLDGAKHHVSEVLTRLGFASRDDAARWWRERQGLAGLPRRIRRRAPAILALAAGIGAVGVGLAIVLALLGGDGEERGTLGPLPPGLWVAHVAFDASPPDHRVRVFNPETGEERFLGPPASYGSVHFAPDGSGVLASTVSGPVSLRQPPEVVFRWLPVDGGPPRDIRSPVLPATILPIYGAWPMRSPDGRYVAWAATTAVVADTLRGEVVATHEMLDWDTALTGGYSIGGPWGWSADSRWFTATVGDATAVLGIDGSAHDGAAPPPGSEPVPFGSEPSQVLEAVMAARPGMVNLGPSLASADGRAWLFRLVDMGSDDQLAVAAVDGRTVDLPAVGDPNRQVERGTFDAVVIR